MTHLSDFDIQVSQETDGSYYAEVKNLPWCFTMWENLEELSLNLKEAITSYVNSLQKDLPKFQFNIEDKDCIHA